MKGKLLGLMLAFSTGWAQESDPFAIDPSLPQFEKIEGRRSNVELIHEVFSLPLAKAASLKRAAANDGELYNKVVSLLTEGQVRQESFHAVTGRSGAEVMVVDGEEYIYPTEWEPPQGFLDPPNLLAYEEGFAPMAPSAFDTQHLGSRWYLTPRFGVGTDLVELRVKLGRKCLAGLERWGVEPARLPMPKFGFAGIQTRLVVRSGEVSLLGTMSEQDGRVRFSFLKATLEGGDLKREEFRAASMRYEIFSLPLDEAAAMRRARGEKNSLYERVVRQVESGKVKQERFICVQGMAGGAAQVEQVHEMIYPSEYDPPGFGDELVMPEDKKAPRRRFFPKTISAFDTKNVGDTVELEMQWNDSGGAEVRLIGRHSALLRRNAFGEGMARWEMPEFTLQDLRAAAILSNGFPTLVGTVTPASEEGRVWWAFATLSDGK